MRLLALALSLILPLAAPAVAGAVDPQSHGGDPRPEPGVARAAAAAPVVPWCGTPRASDDRDHEVANGGARFHAVYAYPSDQPDRFAEFATRINTDALEASAALERQYGRAIRWDMGTDCGPTNVDITVVRLSRPRAALEALSGGPRGQLDVLTRELSKAGILGDDRVDGPRTNAVVWLDGVERLDACGQGDFYDDTERSSSNLSEQGGLVSAIFRYGEGFCDASVVRHEIAHNLGAVGPDAPNSDGSAHCTDAYEDTMCNRSSPSVADFSGEYFDWGNDDYWDPPAGAPLAWWTVNLSSFICSDTSCNGISTARAADEPSATASEPAPAEPASGVAPTLRLRARLVRPGRWRVTAIARGEGRHRLQLRCRRRAVARRTLTLPARASFRVRCRTRPRAAIS